MSGSGGKDERWYDTGFPLTMKPSSKLIRGVENTVLKKEKIKESRYVSVLPSREQEWYNLYVHRSPKDIARSSLANIYLSVQSSPFPNVFLERLLLDLLAISEVRGP